MNSLRANVADGTSRDIDETSTTPDAISALSTPADEKRSPYGDAPANSCSSHASWSPGPFPNAVWSPVGDEIEICTQVRRQPSSGQAGYHLKQEDLQLPIDLIPQNCEQLLELPLKVHNLVEAEALIETKDEIPSDKNTEVAELVQAEASPQSAKPGQATLQSAAKSFSQSHFQPDVLEDGKMVLMHWSAEVTGKGRLRVEGNHSLNVKHGPTHGEFSQTLFIGRLVKHVAAPSFMVEVSRYGRAKIKVVEGKDYLVFAETSAAQNFIQKCKEVPNLNRSLHSSFTYVIQAGARRVSVPIEPWDLRNNNWGLEMLPTIDDPYMFTVEGLNNFVTARGLAVLFKKLSFQVTMVKMLKDTTGFPTGTALVMVSDLSSYTKAIKHKCWDVVTPGLTLHLRITANISEKQPRRVV